MKCGSMFRILCLRTCYQNWIKKIHKTIILPVIYGLHFGIHVNGKEEVAGSWRRLDNEEVHNLCLSDVTGMKLRSVRWCGKERKLHIKFFKGKQEGRRLFGGPRGGVEDNIKMDLEEVE